MSEPTEITSFKLITSMNASLEVNEFLWARPGSSASISWSSLPTEEEIRTAADYLTKTIVNPLLDELVASAHKKLEAHTRIAKG